MQSVFANQCYGFGSIRQAMLMSQSNPEKGMRLRAFIQVCSSGGTFESCYGSIKDVPIISSHFPSQHKAIPLRGRNNLGFSMLVDAIFGVFDVILVVTDA
jgi:hypothetical protein